MTSATPDAYPSVLRMSAPLVVSFLMRAAFTFVDTIYAATIGDAAVAAIGLTIPFEFLMIAIWVGLSTGLTSALSRSMGAHQGRKTEQYLRASWRLALLVSPLFVLLGATIWLVAPRLGLEEGVYQGFRIYGAVLIGGSAFTAFWSVMPDSVVKAHQDTRSTMWAGIWSNITNLVLNTLFLFVFHWGIFGIAFSTVIGRLAGLTYALGRARFHERRRLQAGRDTSLELDPAPYRAILSLAIPSSLTFALMAGETAVINALIAGLENATAAIAAYSIYYRVTLFAANPIIAISVAMLPFAAKRIGESDAVGLRRGLSQAGLTTLVYSLGIVGPLMLFGAPTLAGWLAESPLTARYATFGLRVVPLASLATAPFLLCRPVFEGMGRGRPGLAMAAFRYILLTAPAAWLGMQVASVLQQPALYGLIIGLLAVATASSTIFSLWLRAALPAVPTKISTEVSSSFDPSAF
ncbi:MAG: MATE family efflux transporter [Acidobacteriota bacterium]